MLLLRPLPVFFASLLLSACATQHEPVLPQPGEAGAGVDVEQESAVDLAEILPPVVRPFPEQALYDLLVGDIALIRGQFDLGLEKYTRQARETRDPAVVEVAHRVATHVRDRDALIELALIWIAVAPDSELARRAALQAQALRGDPLAALAHAHWLYQQLDDSEALLSVTAIEAQDADPEQLLDAYRQLPLNAEQQPILFMVEALLMRKLGRPGDAQRAVGDYLAVNAGDVRALLMAAQLFSEQGDKSAALKVLAGALDEGVDDGRLRLQYARYLIDHDRQQAAVQLEIVRRDEPDNENVALLLGLLYMDRGDLVQARDLLQVVERSPQLRADAQYQLGRIAEKQEDVATALVYYRQVRMGRNFLAAASRAVQIVAAAGDLEAAQIYLQKLRAQHPDQSVMLYQMESNLLVEMAQSAQAYALLSLGLEEYPDNAELLYARSMVAQQRDEFAFAERDLRAILALDADNAAALNALGYSMLIHTDRLQEAHALILRAYQLDPGDPAIMDSMGWALFLLGDADRALAYLEKAMAIFPDPEVASHLGEVQWSLGQYEAALKTWREGLVNAPDNHLINDTLRRLGVELE